MVLVFSLSLGGMGTKDVFTGTSEVGYRSPNLVQHLFLSFKLGNVVHLGKMVEFVQYSEFKGNAESRYFSMSLFWDNGDDLETWSCADS